MATWTFLDAYLSSIPAAQRQSLLNLIYSDIQSQKIQTLAEYTQQLNQELATLQAGIGKSTFTPRTAPFRSVTSSANFNDMEKSSINALKIIYAEALLLDTAIDNHQNVIVGNLDSIEATLKSLEKQVDTLELLATNANGFITSVYDSFSEQNTYRLNRVDTVSTTPFIIPDLGLIPANQDAEVINQSLQLPLQGTTDFRITAAYVQNQVPSTATSGGASSEDIPTAENPFALASLLDNDPTKYWAEIVDIKTLYTNRAETDVVFQLAGTQQINNLFIKPFTRFPYQITSIQYTKNMASGVYYELLDDTSEYPLIIGTDTNIQFSSKYADSIKIHIVQFNYSTLRYISQGSNNTITQIFDITAGKAIPTANLSDPNSYFFAMTHLMQDLLGIEKTRLTDTTTIDVYEFLYGIKTITLSQTQYDNRGIYVSKDYDISLAGAIGLNAEETLPNPNLTSIEYDVLVAYTDIPSSGLPVDAGNLVQNILPEEVTDITGEVLDMTDNTLLANATAITRFGVDDLATIEVLQNNIVLSPTFYAVSQDTDTKLVTITISDTSVSPAQRHISFYTINYTPTQDAYVVNLSKHSEAAINLRIFLRSVSPNKMLSPFIQSYSLKFKQFVG